MTSEQLVSASAIGEHGEDLAVAHLLAGGAVILARNWRTRCGEIDIIARDEGFLVFIEVKTRYAQIHQGGLRYRYGTPAEAVTFAKRTRVRRAAASWLTQRTGPWAPVRFDVITVTLMDGTQPKLEHLAGAF